MDKDIEEHQNKQKYFKQCNNNNKTTIQIVYWDKSLISWKHGEFVVCYLLSNSLASECHMPTFRKTLFHLHRRVVMKNDWV